MVELALSAVGRDRPGIVAEVTAVLLGHMVNLRDSQMSLLGGHFSMMLLLAAPDTTDVEALRADLERVRGRLGLDALSLARVREAEGDEASLPSHIVSVYGVDHPGIVHAVAATLAARRVNITDLNTRVVAEEGEAALYAMLIDVALPGTLDPAGLETALRAVASEQDVEVTVRPLEPDIM
jgi:glycine cleavage system transcriptional repressor